MASLLYQCMRNGSSIIMPSAITFEQGTKIYRIKPYITITGQAEKQLKEPYNINLK